VDNIEDLPGVGPKTAEKLREVGFIDFMALAVASAGEICAVAEIPEANAAKIIASAREKIEMGFETAEKLLEKLGNIGYIHTGSSNLDKLLGGRSSTLKILSAPNAFPRLQKAWGSTRPKS
jgi:DNA repair protein RadA